MLSNAMQLLVMIAMFSIGPVLLGLLLWFLDWADEDHFEQYVKRVKLIDVYYELTGYRSVLDLDPSKYSLNQLQVILQLAPIANPDSYGDLANHEVVDAITQIFSSGKIVFIHRHDGETSYTVQDDGDVMYYAEGIIDRAKNI